LLKIGKAGAERFPDCRNTAKSLMQRRVQLGALANAKSLLKLAQDHIRKVVPSGSDRVGGFLHSYSGCDEHHEQVQDRKH
jgi:hypothetical protein